MTRLPRWLVGAVVGAGVCAGAAEVRSAPSAEAARMPGPAALGASRPEAAALNAACEACHAEVAQEWRSSMHAEATTDPIYARALTLEPLPFCRGCHAPEADPKGDAPHDLASLGVGCVTCHVTDRAPGAALAATGASRASPHPVLRSTGFAGVAACASCHEFDFPVRAPGEAAERMQSTVSEHARTSYAAQACASCHMPAIGGGASAGAKHASHAFAGGRDPRMLRAAVRAEATREGTQAIVTLAPGLVGHAFPTGDLFRRLLVSVEAVGDDWAVMGEASRPLQRHFEMHKLPGGQMLRHTVTDDRVGGPDSGPVVLDLGQRAKGQAIAWRVEYQRVEHPLGSDEMKAVVADSVVIAEGLLAAP